MPEVVATWKGLENSPVSIGNAHELQWMVGHWINKESRSDLLEKKAIRNPYLKELIDSTKQLVYGA